MISPLKSFHLGMELAGTYLQSLNKIVKICDRHAGRQGVTIEKKAVYEKWGYFSESICTSVATDNGCSISLSSGRRFFLLSNPHFQKFQLFEL